MDKYLKSVIDQKTSPFGNGRCKYHIFNYCQISHTKFGFSYRHTNSKYHNVEFRLTYKLQYNLIVIEKWHRSPHFIFNHFLMQTLLVQLISFSIHFFLFNGL